MNNNMAIIEIKYINSFVNIGVIELISVMRHIFMTHIFEKKVLSMVEFSYLS